MLQSGGPATPEGPKLLKQRGEWIWGYWGRRTQPTSVVFSLHLNEPRVSIELTTETVNPYSVETVAVLARWTSSRWTRRTWWREDPHSWWCGSHHSRLTRQTWSQTLRPAAQESPAPRHLYKRVRCSVITPSEIDN